MRHRDGGEERHLVVGELRHAQWHCVDESKCLQASKATRIVRPYVWRKKLESVDVNYGSTTHENAIPFRESKSRLACFHDGNNETTSLISDATTVERSLTG